MTSIIRDKDEFLEVDLDDIGELESAMRFKAEHIKAKADPELFEAVADKLAELWMKCGRGVQMKNHCDRCIHFVTSYVNSYNPTRVEYAYACEFGLVNCESLFEEEVDE